MRARLRAGEPAAFGELFDEHARAVYHHGYRLTGDRAVAEDVLSTTFLQAWRMRRRAAARIPGITVVDDATDALGRHGIAIARTDGLSRTEWIFDRTGLQFLGERSVLTEAMGPVPAGTVTASTAIVARAIVDRAGQEPAS
jgi:Sigma-70 region 2